MIQYANNEHIEIIEEIIEHIEYLIGRRMKTIQFEDEEIARLELENNFSEIQGCIQRKEADLLDLMEYHAIKNKLVQAKFNPTIDNMEPAITYVTKKINDINENIRHLDIIIERQMEQFEIVGTPPSKSILEKHKSYKMMNQINNTNLMILQSACRIKIE